MISPDDIEALQNDFAELYEGSERTCSIKRSTTTRDSTHSVITAYVLVSSQSQVPCWVAWGTQNSGLENRGMAADERVSEMWCSVSVASTVDVEVGDQITLDTGEILEVRKIGEGKTFAFDIVTECIRFDEHA